MAKNKPNKFNGKEYTITSPLSIADKGSLINSIAENIFNNGEYIPYMFDAVYAINCVDCYTDIELPKVKDDEDNNVIDENGNEIIDAIKAYKLIEASDIMDVLEKYIDGDIYLYAQDLIEFRKAEYLNNSKANELIEALTGFVNTLDKAVETGLKDIDVKEIFDISKTVASKDEASLAQGVLDFEEAKKAKGKCE